MNLPQLRPGIVVLSAVGYTAITGLNGWAMNRTMLLCLVVCAGGAGTVCAQPPPDFPSRVVPAGFGIPQTATTTGGSIGVPAEQPQVENANKNGAQVGEAPLQKDDLVSTRPTNPLEERLNLSPTFQTRGRIEAEAVLAAQSLQNKATIGDLQNGYGFRRVRLGAQGTIGDSASWVSEVELAGGNVRLRDVFVGLDALPGVRQIRIGHFREPYSLEGMTSSNFITFLERAAVNVLAPARNWGVCGFWWSDDADHTGFWGAAIRRRQPAREAETRRF